MTLLQHYRTWRAKRRLNTMVERTRKANAHYAARRAAGKLGHARKRGLA